MRKTLVRHHRFDQFTVIDALQVQLGQRADRMRAAQFHDTLGMVQRAQGNLPAAVKTFEAASRLSPRDATLKFHLGRALAESSDKVQARKVLQEALTLSPSFPEAAEAKKLLASL